MRKLIITRANEDNFFVRGRQVARHADGGMPLPHRRIVSAEAPQELAAIAEKVLPGHGRMKEVSAAASGFRLQADID